MNHLVKLAGVNALNKQQQQSINGGNHSGDEQCGPNSPVWPCEIRHQDNSDNANQ